MFILLDKVIFHHLPFTRRRGWVCYSSIPSVCQFLCGWLCFSREDRVDLMCSASRTSPGLARQEEVLLQAAAVGRRWVGSGTAELTHSSAIKEVCVKICPVSFLLRGEKKKKTHGSLLKFWCSFFPLRSSMTLKVHPENNKWARWRIYFMKWSETVVLVGFGHTIIVWLILLQPSQGH